MTQLKTKKQFQIKLNGHSKPLVVTYDPVERMRILRALHLAGFEAKAWVVEVIR